MTLPTMPEGEGGQRPPLTVDISSDLVFADSQLEDNYRMHSTEAQASKRAPELQLRHPVRL